MEKVQLEIEIKGSDSIGKASEKTKSLKTQLKELKTELQSGNLTGKAFEEATQKAAKLQDTITDVNNRVKALATDGADVALKGFGDLTNGIVGGFAAAQGAMALFGGENEDLQKQLMKVQGAVALLNGVQAINNSLQSDSAAMMFLSNARLQLLTFAQTRYAAAVGTSTGAMKAFRLVGATLGIGIVVAAIGGLIYVLSQLESKLPKVNLEQKALNDTLTDYAKGTSEANIEVHKMAQNFDLAKKGVISKEKALKDYNDKFGKTLGFAKDLNEAESIFIKKSESYIRLMGARAQANALYAKAAELSVKQIEEQTSDNISSAEKYWEVFKGNFKTAEGQVESAVDLATKNERLKKENIKLLKEEEKAILSAADALVKQSLEEEKRLGISIDGGYEENKPTKSTDTSKEDRAANLKKRQAEIDERIKRFDEDQALRQKEIEEMAKVEDEESKRKLDATIKYNEEQLRLKAEFLAEQNRLQAEADAFELESKERLENAKMGIVEQGSQFLKEVAGQNKALLYTSLLVEKGAAIAGVITNMAKEMSANTLFAAQNPLNAVTGGAAGLAQAAKLNALTKVRAGFNIATIGAATINGVKSISAGGGGAGVGGGVSAPNVNGVNTTNQRPQPIKQEPIKVYVTETDIRNTMRKVDDIYVQSVIR